MKLRALKICNFKCIDEVGYEFDIDKIVVLIGPNNVGKSTIFDAYEAFAGAGSELPVECFRNRNPSNAVSISGVFVDLTPEDLNILGSRWRYVHEQYGECLRVKWEWSTPGVKGQKYTWDPEAVGWHKGGAGGWDTLIASRTPTPLRVGPTDDAETTESQIRDILTTAAKAALKADDGRAAAVVKELEKLTDELAHEVQEQLTDATRRIAGRLSAVFPGYGVDFTPGVGKFEPEKAVGGGSFISIKGPGGDSSPLAQQGAGLRRTFLWSAFGALADIGRARVGRKMLEKDSQRILLIEEPESFLHPPMIRAAREALYGLAEVPEWQVIATTHSPVFVDVSKSHTTIVRIARDINRRTRLFSTDRAQFSDEDRKNLRMIRSCHPTVAEFFFADHVVLVEGETEHLVLSVLLGQEDSTTLQRIAIVNCVGKANIPLFQGILNQFGTGYTVIHDADSPRVQRSGVWQRNPMWTINEKILAAVRDREPALPRATVVAHVPDFEGHYFGTTPAKDKPYQALQLIQEPSFQTDARYAPLRELPVQLVDGSHPGLYSTMAELKQRVKEWVEREKPECPEQWDLES